MAFLVVSYPEMAATDLAWIQEYRRKHDPRYFGVVAPHFSLVFAIHDVPAEAFLAEAKSQAVGVPPIDVELNVATVSRDDSGGYYHEFLLPERGHGAIIRLHDRLYSGAFAKNHRLDLGFVPHVGIGNSADPRESKARVDALNLAGIAIPCRIGALDVIEYQDGRVRALETIRLR